MAKPPTSKSKAKANSPQPKPTEEKPVVDSQGEERDPDQDSTSEVAFASLEDMGVSTSVDDEDSLDEGDSENDDGEAGEEASHPASGMSVPNRPNTLSHAPKYEDLTGDVPVRTPIEPDSSPDLAAPGLDINPEYLEQLDEDIAQTQATIAENREGRDEMPGAVGSGTPLKGRVEAILFLTGRPLQSDEIAELLHEDPFAVEDALMELINDYAFRAESALEIDDTDGYILQIRDDFHAVVEMMVPIEISPAAVRTLSAIAIKAPILQSDLIELRGSNAYEHIHELYQKKLISKKRKGRSYTLNVTPRFYEYFRLMGDKRELEMMVQDNIRR